MPTPAPCGQSGFPLLIALPGGPGHDSNYWAFGAFGKDKLSLEDSITKWYQQGKSKPFLLAMPILNPGPDDGGIYWDGSDIPGQPKMGTWLTEDVPDLMKQNFRTLKPRDGWAFMGSSTGGFVGLKSVLQKPDKFKAVIASGPDIVPDSLLWKGHETQRQENNPEILAKRLIAAKGPRRLPVVPVRDEGEREDDQRRQEVHRDVRQQRPDPHQAEPSGRPYSVFLTTRITSPRSLDEKPRPHTGKERADGAAA
ncbi:alpha/beta hydrolase-fold protein [Streptomyces cinnamoneus]|uniref:alpha/beta hydrolase-fold protein n=1 Tax=Streptomyces cinnamoneus TaxID=53446 RepID=UPI0030B8C4D8